MNKELIRSMLNNLQMYKRSKSYLLTYYVQSRLNKNLQEYYRKLQRSVRVLEQLNSKKVLKKLNQVDKND